MVRRVLPLMLAALALAVLTLPALAQARNAQADTVEGKVVRVDNNKLIMTDLNGKEHTFTINRDVRITCDAKECKLSDLKPGTKLRITTKKGEPTNVQKVEALTKGDFEKLNK
ncbi:MAG TPA: hypothetical protein VFA26_00960 [Gemmataceae bacterium]|nr:hypothetical protein [Gemmataceae bacterium]